MDSMLFTVQDCCCQAVHPFYQTVLALAGDAFDLPNESEHLRGLIRLWAKRYHKVLDIGHRKRHGAVSSCPADRRCVWYFDEMRLCLQIVKGCEEGFIPLPVQRVNEGDAVPLPLERIVHDRDCPNSRKWEKLCDLDRTRGSGNCLYCSECKE